MRTLACTMMLAILLHPCTEAAAVEDPSKPNVILIVADDLGYGDVSCLARQVVPTPNIDRIAAMGVKFTQGYVTSPLCAPSRAGLLSGRHNQRVGIENNDQMRIDPGVPLFPEIFHKAGYVTGLLGKWHPGLNKSGYRPMDYGFDEFYGYYSPFLNYFEPRLYRDETPVKETEYSTNIFDREAEAFIDRNKDHPFFLDVAFNAPHISGFPKNHTARKPYLKPNGQFTPNAKGELKVPTAPPGEAEKYLQESEGDYARADAVATIIALDGAVGRILDKIKSAGLERRTIVVFISDNGGHPENRSENLPLKEFKWSVFEGGFRVPFFMAYPGVLPAGLTYDKPVESFDLFPTCAALADIKPPEGLDGMNLVPYLEGKDTGTPHQALYWRIGVRRAIRQGDWKLVLNGNDRPLLYDIKTDPYEQSNLADQHSDIVADLKSRFQAWVDKINAERPELVNLTKSKGRNKDAD